MDKQIETRITQRRGGLISVNSPSRKKKESQLTTMHIKMSAVITIECLSTLGSFKIALAYVSICIMGLKRLLCINLKLRGVGHISI